MPEPVPVFQPSSRSLPPDLARCLEAHYERFDGLFDRAVPIDLTPPDEGFAVAEFGGLRLKQAILELLPAAYRETLLQMEKLLDALGEMHQERSTPVILAHSLLAATAAAVPIPWIDLPVVMGLQSHLVYRLARLNHQTLDKATFAHVSLAVSGRFAARMGLRALLKFIPWVGAAANAAAAFAFMYASGWVWNWYFMEVRKGHVPTANELGEMYSQQLQNGAELWRTTRAEAKSVSQ